MSIKRMTYENLQQFVANAREEFADKTTFETLQTTVSGKADKATTLAGYGITDGMTAAEVASAISTAIAGADHLQRTIVENVESIDLNAENADKYIYMVAKAEAADGDTYDEYMIVNGVLEKVGDWKVDLSDYATIIKVTEMITAALGAEITGDGNVITDISYNAETGKLTATKGITALQESDFEAYTEAEINALFA